MIKIKSYTFIIPLIYGSIAIAEPAPWGLVVKGSECAAFWAGDECTSFKAPEGWKELYNYKFKDGIIRYKSKKCIITRKLKSNER
jgi:hypothetical protein